MVPQSLFLSSLADRGISPPFCVAFCSQPVFVFLATRKQRTMKRLMCQVTKLQEYTTAKFYRLGTTGKEETKTVIDAEKKATDFLKDTRELLGHALQLEQLSRTDDIEQEIKLSAIASAADHRGALDDALRPRFLRHKHDTSRGQKERQSKEEGRAAKEKEAAGNGAAREAADNHDSGR